MCIGEKACETFIMMAAAGAKNRGNFLKVLIFSRLFPNPGAPTAATFNVEQFRRLASQAEVQVVTPVGLPEKVRSVLKGPALPRQDTVAGMTVHYPTFFYTPGVAHRYHGRMLYWSVVRTVDRIIQGFSPQVIYSTWAYPDTYVASKLAIRHKLPLVGKIHGSDIHSLRPQTVSATRAALQACNAVLSVSDQLAQQCVDLGVDRHRLSTVYNGVDHDRFKPMDAAQARQQLNLSPDDAIVLYVGNLLPVKRVDAIVSAFEAMGTPNRRLLLVGRGPQLQELRQRTKDNPRINLLGPIAHDQLPVYMNAANLVVLFSKREGVPNVLLESMACGTPVVASQVGGVPEVVALPHCGHIVNTQEELSARMDQTLQKSWDRIKIQQHAQSFSWENNLLQLTELLSTAVKDGLSPSNRELR